MTPDAAWKAFERYVAKSLGGKRATMYQGGGLDVIHPMFAVECKHTSKPPLFVVKAMDQARRARANDDQIPIAVIHSKGTRHGRAIVCMYMQDFQALHGDVGAVGKGNEGTMGEE